MPLNKSNVDQKVAVIGAGPAGLTAAYTLAKAGVKVQVFEASAAVGGMARSFELWNQIVDVGPHRFFSSDPRVNQLWLEVAEGNYEMVSRLTRIYYKKKFFDYPLKAFNALWGLGIWESTACVFSYLKARIAPISDESTFEAWVTNRFGARLYKIFFKSYTEKLWGIDCDKLDADFAAQRIKKLDLYEAIKAAIFGGGGNKHKTLVDEFAYPLNGAGAVYETMAAKIIDSGGKIIFNSPIKSVTNVDSVGQTPKIELADGTHLEFDHVISSMPITKLIDTIGAPKKVLEASQRLTFRNTIIVYLEVEGASPFPDQWIYVHEPNLETGRITNFGNWLPSIKREQKNTILCMEYWCYSEDPIWKQDETSLVELAKTEIHKTGLLKKSRVTKGSVLRVPRCYPVYSTGYRDNLLPVEKYLKSRSNLSVIGRYGAFKYNNQDHSILMGLLAADNILLGSNHDLWEINTDYEYQESSRITATGLAK